MSASTQGSMPSAGPSPSTSTTASSCSLDEGISRRRGWQFPAPDLIPGSSLPSPRSNVPRTNAIPIPGSSRTAGPSASIRRRYSMSHAELELETESIGQQLRSIGDDLDRLSISNSPTNRFIGRSRSLSMVSQLFRM